MTKTEKSLQEQFYDLRKQLTEAEADVYPKVEALSARPETAAFFDEVDDLLAQCMPESPLHTTLRAVSQMRGYLKAVTQNKPQPAGAVVAPPTPPAA